MDPLTAALNTANSALILATKVWDVTPLADQTAAAKDWANFTHNIGSFLTSIQDKINAAVRTA